MRLLLLKAWSIRVVLVQLPYVVAVAARQPHEVALAYVGKNTACPLCSRSMSDAVVFQYCWTG
jgi:hypothetical protein